MKKNNSYIPSYGEMRPEYDFKAGQRARYAQHYAQGTNLMALSPDMAAVFPDSEAVNEALRALVRAARQSVIPRSHDEREAVEYTS